MEDLESFKKLIVQLIRGLWLNRWIALPVAFPIMIAGFLFVDQIQDRYTAETKVYIDTTSVLRPLLRGLAIETDFEANVRLMVRQLLSRPNLERAARLMDMDIEVTSDQGMEDLLKKIRKRVNISGQRGGTYVITYADPNREHAKKMVQTLLDIFVEDTLGKSSSESDSAIAFLDTQIEKYESLLRDAEERRENFRRENVGLMPQDGVNYYGQLQELNAQVERTELGLAEAVNRRDELKSQLNELQVAPSSQNVTTNFDLRIEQQEAELDDLLLIYTDQHPDVVNARSVLKSLQLRREKEIEEIRLSGTSSVGTSPVHQELQILLSRAEAEISSLEARLSTLSKRGDELAELVDIVPKIEAEMQRLNRDYEIHRERYGQLVQRRETAKISEDVETGTEQVKFKIIEPPFVPFDPNYPNRILFDLAVLVFALGAGYGLGLLISLLKPVFHNIDDLRDYTGMAVIGGVSKFDTVDVLDKRRRDFLVFVGANLVLLFIALVWIAAHAKGYLVVNVLKSMVAL